KRHGVAPGDANRPSKSGDVADSAIAAPRPALPGMRLQNLARIEDAVRIERLLEPAHQGNFFRRARIGEPRTLERTDAVFGRYRSAEVAHRVIDGPRGGMPYGFVIGAGREADMQIAVANMAVESRDQYRPGRGQPRPAILDEAADRADRHRDVEMDLADDIFPFRDPFADYPHGTGLLLRLGDCDIENQTLCVRGGEHRFERGRVLLEIGAGMFDDDIERIGRRHRRRFVPTLGDEPVGIVPHRLEGTHLPRRALRMAKETDHRAKV